MIALTHTISASARPRLLPIPPFGSKPTVCQITAPSSTVATPNNPAAEAAAAAAAGTVPRQRRPMTQSREQLFAPISTPANEDGTTISTTYYDEDGKMELTVYHTGWLFGQYAHAVLLIPLLHLFFLVSFHVVQFYVLPVVFFS